MQIMFKKDSKKGFTLLEILVVVLIISILTAIAVPFYKHVTLHTKVSTLIPLVKALSNAQESYFAKHGRYTSNVESLNVGRPSDNRVSVEIANNENFTCVIASHSAAPNIYYIRYQTHSHNFANNVHCEAKTDDKDAMWVCQEGFVGKPLEQGSVMGPEYSTFILEGNEEDGWIPTTYPGTSNISLLHGDTCVASNASECTNVNASNGSVCSATNGEGGCSESHFESGSTCDGNTASSCSHSSFDDSNCYAGGGSNSCGAGSTFTNHSICYGESSANNRPTTSCGNSTYIDSTCYSMAEQGYVCGASSYSNSICYGNKWGGCGGNSTYENGSICYGKGSTACNKSTYKSGSVCYAEVKGACSNSSFQSGAYCAGDYCPVGYPKKDGSTWQACPDAGNSGKTC